MERRWREKAVAAQLKQKLAEEDMRRMLLSESTESVAWLNRTLTSMWPHLDRMLSAATRSFLIRTFVGFNQPDAQGKPKSVKLDVTYVTFGSVPIKIDGVTARPATGQIYSTRLDLDFSYRGDMSVELEASLPLGVKIPVALKDLEILGKLKVELSFKDKGAIKCLSICFLTPPTLNFSIRTLGRFDIMDLPTLKENINTILVAQMRQMMTYPNALTFDWSGRVNAEETVSAEDHAKMQAKFVHETVSVFDDAPAQNPLAATTSSPTSAPRDPSLPSPSSSSSKASTTPTSQEDDPNDPLSAATPTKLGSPSVPAAKPTASPQSPSAKPMQSFVKKKEDLNEFLLMSPEEFRGTLSVRIVECSKLRTSDLFSVSPYVNLEMNGISFQTSVAKRTSAPAWNNALFEFPVPRYMPAKGLTLRVHVLDKNNIGSDEGIGYTTINIDRFLQHPDEIIFLNEPLVGAPSGRVHLQCKFMPE